METFPQYQVELEWRNTDKVSITSPTIISQLEIAGLPDLSDKINGQWSAEHLFIASLISAYLVAFLKQSKKNHLALKSVLITGSYTSDNLEECLEIADIIIKPVVYVNDQKWMGIVLKALYSCEKKCPILNSVKARIHIFPTVLTGQ